MRSVALTNTINTSETDNDSFPCRIIHFEEKYHKGPFRRSQAAVYPLYQYYFCRSPAIYLMFSLGYRVSSLQLPSVFML